MEPHQLKASEHVGAIRAFVNDNSYPVIKDVLLSYIKQRTGDTENRTLGRMEGARDIFKDLEEIAHVDEEAPNKKNRQRRGPDPDLA